MKKTVASFLLITLLCNLFFVACNSGNTRSEKDLSRDELLTKLVEKINSDVDPLSVQEAHKLSADFRNKFNLCTTDYQNGTMQNYIELTEEQLMQLVLANENYKKNTNYDKKMRLYIGQENNENKLMMVGLAGLDELTANKQIFKIKTSLPCPDLCDGISQSASATILTGDIKDDCKYHK